MLITVYTHRGIAIQVKSPAKSHEIGYRVNHPSFTGQKFNLIQDAIDAIDKEVTR